MMDWFYRIFTGNTDSIESRGISFWNTIPFVPVLAVGCAVFGFLAWIIFG